MQNFFFSLISCLLLMTYKGNSQVVLTIRPDDCMNCIKALDDFYSGENISKINHLIFQEKHQSDSAFIIKDLYLEDYQEKIIWSDSLFNLYSIMGTSTISSHNRKIQIMMINFNSKTAEIFERLYLPTDTLVFDYPVNKGNKSNPIHLDNGTMISIDKLTNKLYIGDYFSEKLILTLEQLDIVNTELAFSKELINNAAIRSIYNSFFNDTTSYDQQKRFLNAAKERQINQINHVEKIGDSLLIGSLHKFYKVNANQDTAIYMFPMLSVFYKGKLHPTPIQTIQTYFNNPTKYISDINFFYKDNKNHLWMRLSPANSFSLDSNMYFLRRFNIIDSQFIWGEFYKESLPLEYTKVGYNAIYPKSHGSLFMLPLSNKIYSFEGGVVDSIPFISNGILPPLLELISLGKYPPYIVYDFAHDDQYYYVFLSKESEIIINNQKTENYIYKINRTTKQFQSILINKEKSVNNNIKIDIRDPNFYYYGINSNTIIRKKAFEDSSF